MPVAALLALASLAAIAVLGPRLGSVRWRAAALGLAVAAGLLHTLAYDAVNDDAFITMRYAQNLAEGNGPVFNVGERVEGFSNWLQVLLLAGAHALGVDLWAAAVGLGYLCVAATILLAARCAQRLGGEPRAGVAAAALIAGGSANAAFGACGLETSLFTALVAAALLAGLSRRAVLSGVLAALATMTRPEGVGVLFALVVAALFLHESRLRVLGGVVAGFGMVAVPWVVARVSYYGHLLPNHIAAKRGMDLGYQVELGMKYLVRGAVDHAALVACGVAAMTAAVLAWRHGRGRPLPSDVGVLVAFLAFVALPTALGGDWMPGYRFLAPTIVAGSIVAVRLWQLGVPRGGWSFAQRGVAIFAVAGALQVAHGAVVLVPQVERMNDIVRGEAEIGRWLGRRLPPDTLTAGWACGAIPFYSRLPTIDVVGLNDEHIARRGKRLPRGPVGHIAFDTEYVVGRAPAIVTFCGGSGFEATPHDLLAPGVLESYELLVAEGFDAYRRDYETVTFEFTQGAFAAGRFVNLWVRRDAKARLVPLLVDAERGIALRE